MKLLSILVASILPVLAQSGDKPGEKQAPPPEDWNIPEAPPLSPEEALKTFRLQPGFQIEVAASDPAIEAPVEIEFDPEGRMFVLEMRGFMRNVEGTGEDQPVGRISVLEDVDGNGHYEKSTVFADNLVMPRAIAIIRDGLLIAEPPHLWLYRDTNGDGKSDSREEISSDYGNQSNPEHNANGLLWGRDNWIYSANHTVRYRNTEGEWEKDGTVFRGQWGLTQDDYGRLFFNSNSDQFRGDLVPAHYLSRNPFFKGRPAGVNVQLAKDQSTFPARVNAGVNRGYQRGTLRPDGTLARFTGACGPAIYRGGLLPKEYYGAAFLCEPTANLVRCNFLVENEGFITATNAFPNDEFLASTDERFRPVNIVNGPDGALYVVDMYRGVIQHRIYLTTFLRNQALERKLETPVNQGRIYRILPVNAPGKPFASLAKKSAAELVEQLSATNGWTRDTVQQMLVERRDEDSFEPLQQLASKGAFPAAVHALWALHGLGELNPDTLLAASKSAHPKVRASAIRVGENFLRAEGKNEVQARFLALAGDPATDVQLQLMFSLGESKTEESLGAMLNLLNRNTEHPLVRDAAISGLANRELDFLRAIAGSASWNEKTPGREAIIRDLARCIAESRQGERVSHLLELAAARQEQQWQQFAILDGIAGLIVPPARGKEAQVPKPIRFSKKPEALDVFLLSSHSGVQQRVKKIEPFLVWPGKEGQAEVEVKALSASEQELFEKGKTQYPIVCGACHQMNGLGLEGLAPPLVDSDWTTGSPERLARIVLQGARGPMEVKGQVWELEMPPLNILTDEEIAGLLTYVRREWGHTASPVSSEFVKKVRDQTADRVDAWSQEELLKIK